jgi:hypothetical protein
LIKIDGRIIEVASENNNEHMVKLILLQDPMLVKHLNGWFSYKYSNKVKAIYANFGDNDGLTLAMRSMTEEQQDHLMSLKTIRKAPQ